MTIVQKQTSPKKRGARNGASQRLKGSPRIARIPTNSKERGHRTRGDRRRAVTPPEGRRKEVAGSPGAYGATKEEKRKEGAGAHKGERDGQHQAVKGQGDAMHAGRQNLLVLTRGRSTGKSAREFLAGVELARAR